MESDPAVSSTVVEPELSALKRMEEKDSDFVDGLESSSLKDPIFDDTTGRSGSKPLWRYVSHDSDSGAPDDASTTEYRRRFDSLTFGSFPPSSYLTDFETPEMEFDECSLELAGNKEKLWGVSRETEQRRLILEGQ
ncbi:hypothetical protein CLF_105898, partial [Clonorchis sinensis]